MKNNCDENINLYEIYMRDIQKYGTFDNLKTMECLKLYKNGSPNEKRVAKERIVNGLQRFVLAIANKYGTENNLMDVINEGNLGLLMAIEKYNIESDVKFTTYATYWVRKAIMKYITIQEPMVVPNNAIRLATYVPKARQEFCNKNERQPTNEELKELLLEKYNHNFSILDLNPYQSVSIDEKYEEDDEGQEFMECSAYTSRTAECDTDSLTKKSDANIVVNKILNTLSDRDAHIVKCIYGIDCKQKSTDEVAAEFGISNERVRQIAVNSVKKLGDTYSKLKYSF